MNSKQKSNLSARIHGRILSIGLLYDRIAERYHKTKSESRRNEYRDYLAALENASKLLTEIAIEFRDRLHTRMSKEDWQTRMYQLNPNFEVLDMSTKEVVIRCKHCGAILVKSKNNCSHSYLNGFHMYCPCCQDKKGAYKPIIDYMAAVPAQNKKKAASRIIDINEPGMPAIQIKIADEKLKASA